MSISRSRKEEANFKLKTLLEVTEAINENLATDLLLQKYQDILKAELNIGKCMLFHLSSDWNLISSYGFSEQAVESVNIAEQLSIYTDIITVPSFEGK